MDIERARQFFRIAHDSIGQIRKYTLVPYWTHTEAVAEISRQYGLSDVVYVALLGHDFAEDVLPKNSAYTLEMAREVVGDEALSIIIDLTDIYTKEAYPNLNRKARHKLENERLSKVPVRSKNAKICDLLDNTKDIVANDPGFAKTYLREKVELLSVFTDADPVIYRAAVEQMTVGMALLKMDGVM